jgi:small redox-active disulfide protein 2
MREFENLKMKRFTLCDNSESAHFQILKSPNPQIPKSSNPQINKIMKIKILGTGCANCKNLEKATYNAVTELNINAEIEKVEDIVKIMSYGVMRTPALVVDEKVIMYGRVPSVAEIKEMLVKS